MLLFESRRSGGIETSSYLGFVWVARASRVLVLASRQHELPIA